VRGLAAVNADSDIGDTDRLNLRGERGVDQGAVRREDDAQTLADGVARKIQNVGPDKGLAAREE